MKNIFRLLLLGLAAPSLLAGCASHAVKSKTVHNKVHEKRLVEQLSRSQLAEINRNWNLFITYKPDTLRDHWQSPDETVRLRTGDCEDISIAKMLDPAIRSAVPVEQLRLSYVHTRDGQPHMVLVIGKGSGALVLDNLFNEIRTLAESGYQPVYQLDAAGRVYRNDQWLESHPRFEKLDNILSETTLSSAF
ncbi:MAG: transglutaminase-like cysteine peptidase [Sedimenticola sp.]|nr:transglutaminase-like cysteine peptidase [Sedimenticola sp.]